MTSLSRYRVVNDTLLYMKDVSARPLVARRKRYLDGVTGEITTSGSRSTSAASVQRRFRHGNFAGLPSGIARG